jgi:iron complex outermembrane receptor protein
VEGDTNGFLPAVGVLVDNPVGKVRRGINLGEPDYNFYRRRQWGLGYELTHRFSSAAKFTQNLRWGEYHEYQQIIYGAALGADNRTVTRNNFPFKDDTLQFTVDNRLDLDFATGPIEHHVLVGFDYRNYREASAFSFTPAGTIDLFDPVYSPGAHDVDRLDRPAPEAERALPAGSGQDRQSDPHVVRAAGLGEDG